MKRTLVLAVLAAAALAFSSPALAVPIYMKIEGVQGEVLDPAAPGAIEVESPQMADLERRAQQAGKGGTAQISSLNFTKRADKASALLMKASAAGKHFPSAVLMAKRPGEPKPYLKITLTDCIVSSFTTGHGGGGGAPMESFSLNFTRVEFTEVPQSEPKNPPAAGYNLAAAQGSQPTKTPTPAKGSAQAPAVRR